MLQCTNLTDSRCLRAGSRCSPPAVVIWHLATLAFFSEQLRPTERKYSAFDWELLALYLGVRHFRYFLEGWEFVAYTLQNLLLSPWPKYQIHSLVNSSDILSMSLNLPPTFNTSRAWITTLQMHCPEPHLLLCRGVCIMMPWPLARRITPRLELTARRAISGLKLKDISFGPQGATLLMDVSTGHPRPIVPAGWRCKLFDHIHGLSHLSIQATRKLM